MGQFRDSSSTPSEPFSILTLTGKNSGRSPSLVGSRGLIILFILLRVNGRS